MTLEELRTLFVEQAPFPDERALIFSAFQVWCTQFWSLVPTAILWVDGGFVTHKVWAPKDIDVVARGKSADVDSLTIGQQNIFQSLLTRSEVMADGTRSRVQPMAGLVDGFWAPRSDPDRTLAWDEKWSSVTDKEKSKIDGIIKGYVEVKPE